MKLMLLTVILVLPLALLAGDGHQSARAGKKGKIVTKTSTVPQDDEDDDPSEDFRISNANEPFSFQNVNKLKKIKKLTITLTLTDGDTGPGEGDEGELTLGLDGIDTGIPLDGFLSGQEVTRTISGKPDNQAALLAALKDDGTFVALIDDASAGDNTITGSSGDQTTLVIKAKKK